MGLILTGLVVRAHWNEAVERAAYKAAVRMRLEEWERGKKSA
ncbi:MAG TPA: hypothetical protein VD994_12280 [Prosthecobacter sp.]|nr:hypothetical protein [Prosthecobacter sp.]